MTDKKNNSGNQGGGTPQRPPAPPEIGTPHMDHRVLTKETKPDSSKSVRSGA